MDSKSGRRSAKLRTTLTVPAIEALEPTQTSWIAWDDKVTGFGVRVHPTGAKAFIVNFRTGKGSNAVAGRLVIGRVGEMLLGQARQCARAIIARAARVRDPETVRAEALAMPTLDIAFETYMAANPERAKRTDELYRYEMKRYLGDWLSRPLDTIDQQDVRDRFERITEKHGWSAANRAISLLRSVYRKTCAETDGLRDPVGLWLAEGGAFHRKARRAIETPAEILPRWRAGIEAEVDNPVIRNALWFALYTGMLRDEVLTLNWERVDRTARTFRVRHTRGTVSPELPVTRQLAAIFDRRHAASEEPADGLGAWVFPSPTRATGYLRDPHHLYKRIGKAGGAKFWFQGMRNCYLAVAERDLLLPSSLTSRLLNRSLIGGIAAGHPDDWTIEQLRGARTANRRPDRGTASGVVADLGHSSVEAGQFGSRR